METHLFSNITKMWSLNFLNFKETIEIYLKMQEIAMLL